MIKLFVRGVAHDSSGTPMVVLMDEEEKRLLPLWVGIVEIQSIVLAMGDAGLERPLGHDLFLNLCQQFKAHISRVVIRDVFESVFYASIIVETEKDLYVVDSRPSDAIVLALKASAPIYINRELENNLLLVADFLDENARRELDTNQYVSGLGKVLH